MCVCTGLRVCVGEKSLVVVSIFPFFFFFPGSVAKDSPLTNKCVITDYYAQGVSPHTGKLFTFHQNVFDFCQKHTRTHSRCALSPVRFLARR